MASRDTVALAWYKANIAGNAGQSARSSTYWYRGKFLFHDETPIARLEQSPVDQSWHMFNVPTGMYYLYVTIGTESFVAQHNNKTYQRAIHLSRFSTYDLGLRTCYETESVVDDEEWVTLTLWQLEQQHLQWIDTARTTAVKNYAEHPGQAPHHVDSCKKAHERYLNFHRLFAPDRPSLADYSWRVGEIIDSRINKYNDPKKVEQRQRAKARKLLAAALNLNDED